MKTTEPHILTPTHSDYNIILYTLYIILHAWVVRNLLIEITLRGRKTNEMAF